MTYACAGGWQAPEDPWAQLSEAYAWQILMLEAFAHPRRTGTATAGASTSGQGPASGDGLWALLDKLMDAGLLLKVGGVAHSACMYV